MKKPFVIGLIITCIYFAAFAVVTYLEFQHVPDKGVLDWLHSIRPFGTAADNSYGSFIERNGLNSVGDFLSGLVAPMAFLWLVVTAFVQMQELAETRREIADQKKAMQEQVEEARANKVFVGEQTAIMKQQADLAVITYHKNMKLQMFDKRMEVYNEIKAFTEKPFEELITNKENVNFIHLMNKTMFLFAGSEKIIDWMGELSYVVFQTTNGDDIAEVAREWQHLINPDQFHHLFAEHLTIHE